MLAFCVVLRIRARCAAASRRPSPRLRNSPLARSLSSPYQTVRTSSQSSSPLKSAGDAPPNFPPAKTRISVHRHRRLEKCIRGLHDVVTGALLLFGEVIRRMLHSWPPVAVESNQRLFSDTPPEPCIHDVDC